MDRFKEKFVNLFQIEITGIKFNYLTFFISDLDVRKEILVN